MKLKKGRKGQPPSKTNSLKSVQSKSRCICKRNVPRSALILSNLTEIYSDAAKKPRPNPDEYPRPLILSRVASRIRGRRSKRAMWDPPEEEPHSLRAVSRSEVPHEDPKNEESE